MTTKGGYDVLKREGTTPTTNRFYAAGLEHAEVVVGSKADGVHGKAVSQCLL